MKPTKSRVYCKDCGKSKILFESEKKADNFIKFNAAEILEETGKAPIRSYYCIACAGWHVTSKKPITNAHLTPTEKTIQKYREFLEKCPKKKGKLEQQKVENVLSACKQSMQRIDDAIQQHSYAIAGSLIVYTQNLMSPIREAQYNKNLIRSIFEKLQEEQRMVNMKR